MIPKLLLPHDLRGEFIPETKKLGRVFCMSLAKHLK